MRNPERIYPLMTKLYAIWRKNPDMRLMQVLGNTYNSSLEYFIEDEELNEMLDATYPIKKGEKCTS